MSRRYTGTVTVGGLVYEAEADLADIGQRMNGTIVLEGDPTSVIRIIGVINSAQTAVSGGPIRLVSPDADMVDLPALLEADTAYATAPHSFSLNNAAVTINGAPGFLSWGLIEEGAAPAYITSEEEETPQSVSSVTPEMVRIDEAVHPVDNLARLVSVHRRGDESNESLLRRSVGAMRGSKGGTVSGVQRALELSFAMESRRAVRVMASDTPADDPGRIRFQVSSGHVRVFSRYVSESSFDLEAETDIEEWWKPSDLADWINSNSVNFFAVVLDQSAGRFFLDADSVALRRMNYDASERIHLTRTGRVVPGSIMTQETEVYAREVATDAASTYGEWAVDYERSILQSYSTPQSKVSVSFQEAKKTTDVWCCHLRVTPLSTDDGRRGLFEQLPNAIYDTLEDMTSDGLPTVKGYAMLRDIMNSGFGHFWGK